MLKVPLAITGCRVLTPLDDPSKEAGGTWEAIRAGRRVGQHTHVHEALLDPDTAVDRSIRLALAVARPLMPPPDTHLFCGTSKGPATTMLAALDLLQRGEPLPPALAAHVMLGTGAMSSILAQALRLSSAHTSVAACASGLHAMHRATHALWRGECARALVVAADASLHPLFEASFQRLGVLAPATDGIRQCRPFDPAGEGFFLSEAAAAVMLEHPDAASAHPLAWLEQTWIGADSTDLIALDPHTRSLRHGLAACSTKSLPAFVHAHATGTAHDAYELAAIRAAVGGDVPVFSHKAFLGHSLGAAGLVSVALSVACHVHGQTLTGHRIPPDAVSLTTAQGFGGHIAVTRLQG